MTIGTGIFLAALVLSLTYLFVATKDRWRWRRLIVGSIGALAAVAAVVGGGLWGYNAWQDRVRPIDGIGAIRLGMSKEDLLFFKGKPDVDDEELTYLDRSEGIWYFVTLAEGKVDSVSAACQEDSPSCLPSFFGIHLYSGTGDVERRLGQPDDVSTSEDGMTRNFLYRRLNLVYSFTNDRLRAIQVRAGGTFPMFDRSKAQ